jgi:hypothetical protein
MIIMPALPSGARKSAYIFRMTFGSEKPKAYLQDLKANSRVYLVSLERQDSATCDLKMEQEDKFRTAINSKGHSEPDWPSD